MTSQVISFHENFRPDRYFLKVYGTVILALVFFSLTSHSISVVPSTVIWAGIAAILGDLALVVIRNQHSKGESKIEILDDSIWQIDASGKTVASNLISTIEDLQILLPDGKGQPKLFVIKFRSGTNIEFSQNFGGEAALRKAIESRSGRKFKRPHSQWQSVNRETS